MQDAMQHSGNGWRGVQLVGQPSMDHGGERVGAGEAVWRRTCGGNRKHRSLQTTMNATEAAGVARGIP